MLAYGREAYPRDTRSFANTSNLDFERALRSTEPIPAVSLLYGTISFLAVRLYVCLPPDLWRLFHKSLHNFFEE